jgi:hypothetical protein
VCATAPLQAAWMVLYVNEVVHSKVQASRMAVAIVQKQVAIATYH